MINAENVFDKAANRSALPDLEFGDFRTDPLDIARNPA
jgi:hypothetical protein